MSSTRGVADTEAPALPDTRKETLLPVEQVSAQENAPRTKSVLSPDKSVLEFPVVDLRDQLRQLPHFDPSYPYAPFRYRYERHHTTDPNYLVENVSMPQDSWQTPFVEKTGPCLIAWGEITGPKWRYTVEAGMYHIEVSGGISASADIALWNQDQLPAVFRSLEHRVTGNPPMVMEDLYLSMRIA